MMHHSQLRLKRKAGPVLSVPAKGSGAPLSGLCVETFVKSVPQSPPIKRYYFFPAQRYGRPKHAKNYEVLGYQGNGSYPK